MLAIIGALLALIQIPFFGINMVSGVAAGYLALFGTLLGLFGWFLITKDHKRSVKNLTIFACWLSFYFLVIIFVRNWASSETHNWNIINLIVAIIVVVYGHNVFQKYYAEVYPYEANTF
ncbi:hypothetical protein KC901_02360 [Patescibacteria group bacterium]|nr:hypothetical protein [Patescibacteria group bacterium]